MGRKPIDQSFCRFGRGHRRAQEKSVRRGGWSNRPQLRGPERSFSKATSSPLACDGIAAPLNSLPRVSPLHVIVRFGLDERLRLAFHASGERAHAAEILCEQMSYDAVKELQLPMSSLSMHVDTHHRE